MQNAISICKAFGDETRMQIMLMLFSAEELCVCELTAALDLSQPKISRHINILRGADLVESERRGQWMFYRIASSAPAWVDALLQSEQTQFGPALMRANERLSGMASRPSSCC